jgi:TonB dependent receptor/TonB-dependent Receptor Plug Domain
LTFFAKSASFAQVEWNLLPWTVVGDSTLPKSDKVILTGSVTTPLKEPVVAASLSMDLFKYFDYSDKSGRYLMEVPTGRYHLTVRHVGMLPIYVRIKLFSSGMLPIQMHEGVIDLEDIVVSTRARDANVTETISGVSKMSISEVRALPTLMGEVDILKNIQTLPGVTSVGEGSAAFNVRGGRSDQNLILLNGVPIFNASHALGFVSGFNQDAINGFTFYKGNVPANFGGRTASVLDVTLKQGNFEKWKYNGGIGLISSRFTADGPIKKDKTSLLISGRASHANWVLNRVKIPTVQNSEVFFYDANANLSHKVNDNSSLNLMLYSSHDFFRFSDQFGFSWQNYLGNAEWRSRANKKASPLLSLSFGRYGTTLIDPSGFNESQLQNALHYFKLKEAVNYQPNDKHSIVAGVEATANLPQPEKRGPYKTPNTVTRVEVKKNRGIEAAFFVQDDIELSDRFSISTGLRFSYFSHIGQDTVFSYEAGKAKTMGTMTDTLYYKNLASISSFNGLEPRVSFRLGITDKQSIKMGYNRMFQYIHLISNTTTPTPVDVWQISNAYSPPQVSDNFSLGYFHNLNDNMFETSFEGFYKSMTNLVEYKDFPKLFLNTHLETELLSGRGYSYGLELYVNKRKGWWTGWLSYTFTETQIQVKSPLIEESINRGRWYPPNYNKPHNFNFVINRRLNKGSSFSMVTAFSTGRPITAIETSYITDGVVVPVYSDRNKYEIPNYFRMDFSFTIGNIFKKLDDSLVFSFYNLFGRENPYSVFYQRPRENYFIPKPYKLSILGTTLPSITYNVQF